MLNLFKPLPQVLENVHFSEGLPLENALVRAAIEKAEKTLAGGGRLLVRSSGTEPLIRVMAEGANEDLVRKVVTDVCAAISASKA